VWRQSKLEKHRPHYKEKKKLALKKIGWVRAGQRKERGGKKMGFHTEDTRFSKQVKLRLTKTLRASPLKKKEKGRARLSRVFQKERSNEGGKNF